MKSKLYRIAALLFAGMGFVIFSYLYAQKSNGEFWVAMRDPFLIVLLIFPFIPAIILSWMATSAESKVNAYFEETEQSKAKQK